MMTVQNAPVLIQRQKQLASNLNLEIKNVSSLSAACFISIVLIFLLFFILSCFGG